MNIEYFRKNEEGVLVKYHTETVETPAVDLDVEIESKEAALLEMYQELEALKAAKEAGNE